MSGAVGDGTGVCCVLTSVLLHEARRGCGAPVRSGGRGCTGEEEPCLPPSRPGGQVR